MRTTKILLSLLCVLLCGCASSRTAKSENVNTEQHDSVRVETVTIYVPDTVFIEIPAQAAQRETRDSLSRLENDYATSEARINPDGSLFHSLRTKPQEKPVQIQKPVERQNSVYYRTRTVTVTKVQKVPRELTWWQQTQIYGFWAAIIFVLITYSIKIFKAHMRRIREK